MGLVDSFGRNINYLRLSVTDRCNMRCLYCMPAEGVEKVSQAAILSYEELLRVARASVALGIEKIRVTGGEPLVRRGILPFLGQLAAIPGLRQLVLTTNGLNLVEMAAGLRAAGVQRLNISLDSLQPATFAAITRGADVRRVLAGIEVAERAGFPVKVNMVVMRGVNDHEVVDFARMTLSRRISVRFIEYMPAIRAENWQELVVPGDDMIFRLGREFRLFPVEREAATAGPARVFRLAGAAGTIGIITPVSGHFCGECNRIRVTSSGAARSCLFDDRSLDLRPFLGAGNEAGLKEALLSLVAGKPGRHLLGADEEQHAPFTMASIGG